VDLPSRRPEAVPSAALNAAARVGSWFLPRRWRRPLSSRHRLVQLQSLEGAEEPSVNDLLVGQRLHPALPRLGGAAEVKELTAVAGDPQARFPHLLRIGRAEDVGLEVGGNAWAGSLFLGRPNP
jgi:hypothetical protein